MSKIFNDVEPVRLDLLNPPIGRPRKHKYDCFRSGRDKMNVYVCNADFVKDYRHPRLSVKQLRSIISSYFKAASEDIIRKNEIFTWGKLGKIFIGKTKNRFLETAASDYYHFKFYFQREASPNDTAYNYAFKECTSVMDGITWGRQGLRNWVGQCLYDPKTRDYDAIFMGNYCNGVIR